MTATNALAAGAAGTILRLDGAPWRAEVSGTTNTLRGGAGSPSDVFLVGDGGTIVRSPDLATWSPQSSGTSEDLTGADENGFVVGAGGTILHYDGTTWTTQR